MTDEKKKKKAAKIPPPEKPHVKPKAKAKAKPKPKPIPVEHVVTLKFKVSIPVTALAADEAVTRGTNEVEQFLHSCPIEGVSFTVAKAGRATPTG